jgi:predicted metal-dependent peptidase
MGKLSTIKYEPLKNTIIEMQIKSRYNYYGYFALYFDFIEKTDLPAAAGVTVKNRRLQFYYNPEICDRMINEHGDSFMRFLVMHEVQHILLNHVMRTGERNHKLSNIAQDMLINTMIKNDYGFNYTEFFYADRSYTMPIKFDHNKYSGPLTYEALYNEIFDQTEEEDRNRAKGDGDPESNSDGEGGQGSGNGESQPSDGSGSGKLVDDHEMKNEMDEGETAEEKAANEAMVDSLVREIHDSLKARGFSASSGVEQMFNFKKQKPIVNVFKRVFGNGKLKAPTYRKLSRRHHLLKGKRKENKDVNIILDTSGSLYSELDEYIGQVVGNYNCYVIQIDTKVQFAGHIKNIQEWKKLKKMGCGGTILQPAIEKLKEEKRGDIQTVFVSDFYCETLDFKGIKGDMIFVKTKGATDPVFKNCARHKVVESYKETN